MINQLYILLVNPACQDKRITDDDAKQVPIGLYYIAALLMENGFETAILNLAGCDGNPDTEFIKTVRARLPDMVGFSVTNPSRINAMACARALKKKHPHVPVVFGGPAPTFLYEHLLDVCPAIDFIVQAEGEQTMLELANAIESRNYSSLEQIKGLIFKQACQLIKTPARSPVEDLDVLVHPSKYFTFAHLSMSRGCPGKCTFCGSPKFWPNQQVRFHSPDWMAEEIEAQFKNGVSHFFMSDDTFTMDRDRVIELCATLIEKKLPITWNAISRVDYIDPELLFIMRKAGCIQISFGVESGSSKIRKILGKPIAQEKIIQAFEQTLSHGILPRAYFIYGSPGETSQTIQESIDLMHRIRPLSAVFYMLVLFPGTYLYQRAKDQGRVSDDIWHGPIEDLPWFEIDETLDFKTIKGFGDQLRSEFFSLLETAACSLELVDKKELYPFHADFLSRLAMTFSHGEYKNHPQVRHPLKTAAHLFEKALEYAPDVRAFLGLAMILQQKKDFYRSLKMLQQGLGIQPDHKDLNICKGVCLMNMGRFSQALPYFEKFETSADAGYYIRICRQHIKC